MGKLKKLKKLTIFLFLILPFLVIAQENINIVEPPSGPRPIGGGSANIQGTVDCFDYYKFGSVSTQIYLDSSNISSGTQAKFKGQVTNNNNYPIVSGSIYAKIFKADEKDETQIHLNGYSVVDHFFAVKNINLDANSTIPVEFTWNVPLYATSGDYYIATYFIVDNKFNISGLSFTDDIIGDKYDFNISSELKGGISFDKNTVKINNNPHHFATFIPSFLDEEVSIKMDVVNNGNTKADFPVNFKLYSWDSLQESNLISQESQNLTLEAGERKTLNYVVKDNLKTVYFVVAELIYQDSKSILNVRFSRQGVDNTRLNFVGPTTFPFKKGTPVSIYACMHGTSNSDLIKNNRLVLELKDSNGSVLDTYEYNGDVSGAIRAVKRDFTPSRDIDNFTISAKLYNNEKLTDFTDLKYDCSLINKELCNKSNLYLYIFIAFCILILATLIIYSIKRKKLITVLILVLGFNLLLTPVSEAKSVTWNSGTINQTLYYYWNRWSPGGWDAALSNFNISVSYFTKVIDLDTNQEIKDGDVLRVGSRVKFELTPHKNEDISWFGVGYSQDSPYGHWVENSVPPASISCVKDDYIGQDKYPDFKREPIYEYTEQPCTWVSWGGSRLVCPPPIKKVVGFKLIPNYRYFDIHIPLNIDPPTKNITQNGTAILECQNNDKTICTIKSPGTIKPLFTFSTTQGKFYYRYTDFGICYGNNVPLNSGGDYIVTVPTQTISYSFTAVSPGNPPTPPTINLVSGKKNIKETLTFSFVSTDPEKDKIKYLIDWDADDGVDTINTTTDFADSGVPATSPKSWLTGGSKRIKAKAQDESGNISDWGYYTFTIDPCVALKDKPCTASNTCGTNTGVYSCDGSCSVLPPVIPVGYGTKCTATNMCGMTNTDGKISCDAKCTPAPSDSLCLIDSGVRIDQGGGDIVKIAADPTLNPKSPVRVMTKDGVRSIPVTSNFSDPNATKIRIMTKDGVRALIKYILN